MQEKNAKEYGLIRNFKYKSTTNAAQKIIDKTKNTSKKDDDDKSGSNNNAIDDRNNNKTKKNDLTKPYEVDVGESEATSTA